MLNPWNTPQAHLDLDQALGLARQVLDIESQAILGLKTQLGPAWGQALAWLLACPGRVVVTGMGKSGHIGRKMAATLASTGTPAFFMHPAEAAHGDLGMLTRQDVLLALSNSGESDEVLALLPFVRRMGTPVVGMTGNPQSTLARESDIHLLASVAEEACPLGLAPTASTTAALALGDALAVTLLHLRGFREEDYALTHPGGSLGRRLLVHVRDVMHAGERLPSVPQGTPLRDALTEMSAKGLGMTAVLGDDRALLGVFTDGDLRRALDRNQDIRQLTVDEVMSRQPRTIGADRLAIEAVQLMDSAKVNALLVVDGDARVVGALHMHDLLRARVV